MDQGVFPWLVVIAAGLVTLTALSLLMSSDWRMNILLIAIQYVGVFILVAAHWPLAMAISKLVVGWIAGAVLGMAINSTGQPVSARSHIAAPNPLKQIGIRYSGSEQLFHLLSGLAVITLLGMAYLSRVGRMVNWFPGLQPAPAWGALALISLGLVRLGFSSQPLAITLGLLTAFSGFEVLYSQIQNSTLVALLLAGITLGLTMAGAYLLLAPEMQESE